MNQIEETFVHPAMPPMPENIAKLPRDPRGFPIPWFVEDVNGVRDFRVVSRKRKGQALLHSRCWVCGEDRGRPAAFVIGPMCAINRISSEPPSHLECATFAAQACPFLVKPMVKRREDNLPVDYKVTPGHIDRNPGVALIWVTSRWQIKPVNSGDYIISLGDPQFIACYREGREATKDEVRHSIETGLPILQDNAKYEGPKAVAALERATKDAYKLLKL